MNMIESITDQVSDMRSVVNDIIFEKTLLESQLKSQNYDKKETEKDLDGAKGAQEILMFVARETQSNIEAHLSRVVTMALSAVEVEDENVPKPPEFIVKMVERRGSTECDLLFKEGDREQNPLECSGYGYVDIADYSLRVAYALLEEEYCSYEVRKTLISDEPFRNCDPKLQYKVSEMLQMISNDLGFQQIIVSHAKGVNIDADVTFHVVKNGKISKVSRIE